MDVSADLHELARTPITVISAGVKSILDIGRTLEYLVCILKIFILCCGKICNFQIKIFKNVSFSYVFLHLFLQEQTPTGNFCSLEMTGTAKLRIRSIKKFMKL